jgi:hypothetical protein
MEGGKKTRELLVALALSEGANEEVTRARNRENLEIEPKIVEEIIEED